MTPSEINVAALKVRMQILHLFAGQDIPINVGVLALADVLADMAVQSDMTEGRAPLDARLDAFTRRFEETYRAVRDVRETDAFKLTSSSGPRLC